MDKHDLLLKGLKIFREGAWTPCDVAVSGENVAEISPAGEGHFESDISRDFTGCYGSPGWVDLHSHILPLRYKGIGTHAAKIGLTSGVTALLDVGTAGAANFDTLYNKVIRKSATPVYSLLNIKNNGIRFWKVGRESSPDDDLDAMAEVAGKYPDIIKGIKITASSEHMLPHDPMYYMRKARDAGDRLGLPVMVHIGRTPPSLEQLLALMKTGDIITHCFRNGGHAILDGSGKVRGEVLDAAARGIRFDIGHGVKSFSFDVAEKALDQGFSDFTISSDLYMLSTPYRAKNFANVLSKFLSIGMTLEDVMERCSKKAARVIGLERELDRGKAATITIFEMEKGKFTFRDCWRKERKGTQRIKPVAVVFKGKLHEARQNV